MLLGGALGPPPLTQPAWTQARLGLPASASSGQPAGRQQTDAAVPEGEPALPEAQPPGPRGLPPCLAVKQGPWLGQLHGRKKEAVTGESFPTLRKNLNHEVT